jgi:hypothetical protein
MSRLRVLAVSVEALRPGAFHWVLLDSFADDSGFRPFARSELSFATYELAWEAGCAALQSVLDDPAVGLFL